MTTAHRPQAGRDACDDCLRRTDLIGAIAGRLQIEFKQRNAPQRVLALPDDELLEVGAEHVNIAASLRLDDSPPLAEAA
jgi:DNA processing protein